MDQLQDQLEGIPGFSYVQDYWNDFAGDKFNKDPYKSEETGKRLRLPPDITTKEEQRVWKRVQNQAWQNDRCFMGSCGVGLDCGLGLAPLVALIFPIVGPLLMYAVHSNLVKSVNEQIHIPNKVLAKMQGRIALDLCLTLPPLIGAFFSWMNGCSTNNAAIIYGFMLTRARERASGTGVHPVYAGTGTFDQEDRRIAAQQQPQARQQPRQQTRQQLPQQQTRGIGGAPVHTNTANSGTSSFFGGPRKKKEQPATIVVAEQQQSGFV